MSEFRNYVCWKPERLAQVMADGVAERIEPADRAATHFPMHMRRVRMRVGPEGQWTQEMGEATTAEEVLQAFLANPSASLAAAILGDAGTGKTHLLKWIHAHLPQSDDTKVIVIPRKDVGLPGVVALLVEGLPGKDFEAMRRSLAQAGARMTPELAKELIATNLAAYVRRGTDPVGQTSDEREIVQAYMRPHLPDLLLDRAFIEYLTGSQGPFAAMGEHLMRWAGGEATENPMSFDAAVLTKAVRGLQPSAEKVAGDLRADPALARLAASLCNHELRLAVQGQVAQGAMSNIGQLLEDVRKEYARQGKKIILLFEDLARAQFIDEELVLACVGDQRPDGPRLAPMRTLFACTTGMFRQLRETVVQRIQGPVVTLDDPENAKDPDVARSATARYLNAVRTPAEAVQHWFGTPVEKRQPLPSACEACPHKAPCHAAFGAHGGVGLYPFTDPALGHLARARVGTAFVARKFVRDVLYATLDDAGEAIPAGEHPSADCVRDVEPARAAVAKVAARVAPTDPGRWERAARLYGMEGAAPEECVPKVLADAFGLQVSGSHVPGPTVPVPSQGGGAGPRSGAAPTEGSSTGGGAGTPAPAPTTRPPPGGAPHGLASTPTPTEKRVMAWADEQGKAQGVHLLQTDVTNMRTRLRSLVLGTLRTQVGTWGDDVVDALFPSKSINFLRMDMASDADQVSVPLVMPGHDTTADCRSVAFLYMAAENLHAGLGAAEPDVLWKSVLASEYMDLATFAEEVAARVAAVAAAALGGRRQAAQLAVAGAVWARLEHGLPVDGRDAAALAASVLAQDTPAAEREALLKAVGFVKGAGARSTLVDGALLHEAAQLVLAQPLPDLERVACPRESGGRPVLASILARARQAAQAARRDRDAARAEVLADMARIKEHAGGLPTRGQRQELIEACKDLLGAVERVAPWDRRQSQELREAMPGFLECGIEGAAGALEAASKLPSDLAALVGLRDPGLQGRIRPARHFLQEAAALAKHAEDRADALRQQERGRYGGATLEGARKATLDDLARMLAAMTTIEEGDPHVA